MKKQTALKRKTRTSANPSDALPVRLEKELMEKAKKLLSASGLLWWRQNSGVVPIKGTKRFVNLGTDGLPDFIIVVPPEGQLLGLELKSATGSMREAQETMASRFGTAGALYCVARTVDEIKKVIGWVINQGEAK